MNTPKPVNKRGCAVLDILTAGLDNIEDHRKIDNNGEDSGIMAVHVECIGEIEGLGLLYSVAHYHKQCGDLMRDPDMVFLKMRDGRYYPTEYRQDGLGIYQASVEFEGSKVLVKPKMQADHAVFAGSWMQNIKEQQRL